MHAFIYYCRVVHGIPSHQFGHTLKFDWINVKATILHNITEDQIVEISVYLMAF